MLQPRERPRRRVDQYICAVFDSERAIKFRKGKSVTNAEADIEVVDIAKRKGIAGGEASALVERNSRNQVGLAIFGNDFAIRIDKNLRVVDAPSIAVRDAADDRDRKGPCYLLQFRDSSFFPRRRVFLNGRHRVAGIDHLREHDQISASLFRERREIAGLAKIGGTVTKRARNLGSGNLHRSFRFSVAAGVSPAISINLQPTRLPLQILIANFYRARRSCASLASRTRRRAPRELCRSPHPPRKLLDRTARL